MEKLDESSPVQFGFQINKINKYLLLLYSNLLYFFIFNKYIN